MNNDARDEVRSRLAIEDVIGEYVSLKRAGRNWKGLSPFGSEKTPSFFVSPDKNIWHDFSSNQGGDIFSFIMLVEGIDFRASLELLARKAGVDLSLYDTGTARQRADKKRRVLALNESVALFFQRQLYTTPHAVVYAKERGLNKQSVHEFRLGYAPSHRSAVTTFLRAKGYTAQEIRDAGLANTRGNDLFHERLIIPLSDGQGQIIGFTGRIIADVDNAPKYLNTPQTIVYDKGRHVFGLYQAKQAIRDSGYVVIVEGNLDVISSHQAGVKQVVATAGTAMTEYHLKTLRRLTNDIRICFDADKAGIAATERAIVLAQRVDVDLSIVSLPTGYKDPDDVVRVDVTLWQTALEQTQPAIEWVIDQYMARSDMNTAVGKRRVTTRALTLLRQVDDPIERDHYFAMLAHRTGATQTAVEDRFAQLDEAHEAQQLKPIKTTTIPSANDMLAQDCLLALMTCEEGAIDVAKSLQADYFEGVERQALYTYLVGTRTLTSDEHIPEELQYIDTYVKIVLLKAETRYQTLGGQERLVEAVNLVKQVKQQHRTRQKQQLIEALRRAERTHDDAESDRLRAALNALIKED